LGDLSVAVFRTTFRVDAPRDVVWAVLSDFGRYPDWNPSVPAISGDLSVGSTVSLTLAMPGRPSPNVKAQLTEVVPARRLRWHGNVGADWLFAGDRDFVIEATEDGAVDITHVEDVRGAMFPLFRLAMGSAIQQHHDGFNAALKQRAEEVATSGGAPFTGGRGSSS
jgi:hypothetical protein